MITETEKQDYLKTLKTRQAIAESARAVYGWHKPEYRRKIDRYLERLSDNIEALSESRSSRRDPDREPSYEDYMELRAPVSHPGDDWMGNEDI